MSLIGSGSGGGGGICNGSAGGGREREYVLCVIIQIVLVCGCISSQNNARRPGEARRTELEDFILFVVGGTTLCPEMKACKESRVRSELL
jgi:hypothetical protein